MIIKKTQYSILFFLPRRIGEFIPPASIFIPPGELAGAYSPSILTTQGYHNRATLPLVVNCTIVDSESEKTEIGFDTLTSGVTHEIIPVIRMGRR